MISRDNLFALNFESAKLSDNAKIHDKNDVCFFKLPNLVLNLCELTEKLCYLHIWDLKRHTNFPVKSLFLVVSSFV